MIDSKIFLLIATCLTFIVIWMVFLGITMAFGPTFSSEFFYTVTRNRQSENVVVAPTSVRIALACLYMGADDTTAAEIKIEAHLMGIDREEVAKRHGIRSLHIMNQTEKLRISNRIFIDREFSINPKFDRLSQMNFNSSAESVNFLRPQDAAEKINNWTEIETNGYAGNSISVENLNSATTAIVVNTNSISGMWHRRFNKNHTLLMPFYVNASYISYVYMMFQENLVFYGDFPQIRAKAISLPLYKSRISMLVLLPYNAKDLAFLEESIKHFNMVLLKNKMKFRRTHVYLPRFRFKFSVSLQPILEELGIKAMFTDEANFSNMVDDFKICSVSEFKHHAFIEIDEFGIGGEYFNDAVKVQPLPMNFDVNTEIFQVNRPFLFAIADHKNIYLAGHVVVL